MRAYSHLLAGLLIAGPASHIAAQTAGIHGVVVSARTTQPLPNAVVTVDQAGLSVATDGAGRFGIRALTRPDVELVVRAVGYEPWRGTVHAADTTLRIALTELAIELQQVVTIGTADASERRQLGNAIAIVDAPEVVNRGTVSSLEQLLNGRVPGLAVQPSSGSVGSGARLTIRGGTSFSLDNTPLLYVDGVRVNNGRNSGPINQSNNSRSTSALDDIDPSDIERVEVIRGPSAATLYGTEAASGVVNIVTKHGVAGPPRWSFATRQGRNFMRNGGDVFPLNYQRNAAGEIVTLDVVAREKSRGTPIFHQGGVHDYSLNVSGGSDQVRYYVAGGASSRAGVTMANWLRRESGRANLQIAATPRLEIDLNAGYVTGPTHENVEGGLGGLIWSTLMADPRKLPGGGGDSTRRGFFTLLPEEFELQVAKGGKLERAIGRLTTSVRVDHHPTAWLRQRLVIGHEQGDERNTTFGPRVDALLPLGALLANANGFLSLENVQINYETVDYAATASLSLPHLLTASTSLGGQYNGSTTATEFESATDFPAEGLSSIGAATMNKTVDSDRLKNVTIGAFAQEQIAWRDRLFLTFALRADDNSSFGANFDRVYYPKASVSWILGEEPFFRVPLFNTLRLRAAYGEAGKQPAAFDALETFGSVAGPNDVPTVTPKSVGNPDLGPERVKELEAGVDVGALHDRLGLELTYYDKRTTSAILQRQYAPSGGFPGTQLFNAGEVRNSGLEVDARMAVVRSGIADWDIGITLATNHNMVASLGDPSLRSVVAGTYLRHEVGYPVGSWFEKRVVSARLDASGKPIQALCDDGAGGAMPCVGADNAYGTADDAPSVFLGRSIPSAQGAATTSLALLHERLRVTATADFASGQHKFDANTWARCTADGGRCRENFYPTEFDARRIAGIASNDTLFDWAVSDASFVKLREISVAYSLPPRWCALLRASAATITVAGRELHTWTRYRGLEPEAMYLGGTFGGSYGGYEAAMYPQPSEWLVALNLGF